MNLYFRLPTLEPLATIPPGKLVMVPGTLAIASAATSAPMSAAIWFSPMTKKLPPATPLTMPNSSSPTYSPFMIGMTQHFLPPTSFWYSYPSPKKWSFTAIFSSALVMPLKTAVVGAVRTHSASLSTTWSLSFFLLAQIRIETPGRPSGVWVPSSSCSMPASHGQPIADVAKPVASVAAFRAHS